MPLGRNLQASIHLLTRRNETSLGSEARTATTTGHEVLGWVRRGIFAETGSF